MGKMSDKTTQQSFAPPVSQTFNIISKTKLKHSLFIRNVYVVDDKDNEDNLTEVSPRCADIVFIYFKYLLFKINCLDGLYSIDSLIHICFS